MSHDEFAQVERLFQAAADLPTEERSAFLEKECRGDADLESRVRRLLDRLDETVNIPGRHLGPFPAAALTEGPGATIGRYKLLQVIGEGGFGVVYMAEQTEPVVRKVALKIIKLGMDTREVVARFEAERQALALMDHPHIAKVLDGGATDSGRPYFVMELVRGVSITEFCTRNDLGTQARLELFAQVCQAVQHAHQKGVIHRDIKPTNVLVTLDDGVPMPKVIDFGVAKAMHTRLTEKTLFTRYEQFVGTPAYMSPEQAELSALDVDTRADIYSLGVLLYELLTGTTPFDTKSLLEAGLAEVQRVIREEEPPRPSIRVSTAGAAGVEGRGPADAATLGRVLAGDLDWIVMKALEKDRSRRYGTAAEFGEDIRRHLENQPVVAGPPRASYRIRKFLVRNRVGVGAGLLIAFALVVGIVGTTIGMFEARQNEERAQGEAKRALAAFEFLLSTLSLANPEVALNPEVSVLTLLEHTSGGVSEAFGDYPGLEVRVRDTIGRAYTRLSRYELAEPHLRRVVEMVEAHTLESGDYDQSLASAGFDSFEFYRSLWTLTNVCFNLELGDSFEVASRARRVGLTHLGQSYPHLAETLDELSRGVGAGAWSHEPGALAQIPDLFDLAVARAEAALPAGDPLWEIVSDGFLEAGYSVWYTPHEPLGEKFWGKALEIQRRELPPDHPSISATVNLLVGILNKRGQYDRSEALLLDSLAALRRVHPEGAFPIASAETMLGETLTEQKRFEEAEVVLLRSHEVTRNSIKDDSNWLVLESTVRLIGLYDAWERPAKAAPYRDSLALAATESTYALRWETYRRALGEDWREVHDAGTQLDQLCGTVSYLAAPGGRKAEGLGPVVAEFLRRVREESAEDSLRGAGLARLLLGWANSLDPSAHAAERCVMADAAQELLAEWVDKLPLSYAEACVLRSGCARSAGDPDRARLLAREAWRGLATRQPRGNWFLASAKVRVARGLIESGLFEPAEMLLLPALEALSVQLGTRHGETKHARAQLAKLYQAWGRAAEASKYSEGPGPWVPAD